MTTTRPPLETGHLAPTSLEALNEAAGLLTRVDRKYLVPAATVQDVANALTGRALVLQIDDRRRFAYASTYFDTLELSAYMLAARKRRRRFKVRTRTYLDSGICFLEVKTRGARESTVKERLPYRLQDADRLTPEGLLFVADCLASSGICSPQCGGDLATRLVPVMATTYWRTTLHLPDDEARTTIDTGLTWTSLRTDRFGTVERGPILPAGGLAIVETKSPATPGPADRFLWSQGHRPARLSKYATGMAALRPELPANKWHRVLTHELAPATRAHRPDHHDHQHHRAA
ncbi:MAG: polyphosphate polymerase domain-containing protein [Actinomyces sp.]|uniref:polyphosphate polymerase domain-containing protein n=1 Tax=Actinomyces sp. TaxID=29317 RepID=UPI0026DC9CA4|nr:polyphosphate polymerase domain-containing protein [Actinomyces sp.]MDO4243633.1 polyphosphate polymerase domain-containing protein [Actinomyces sp.]